MIMWNLEMNILDFRSREDSRCDVVGYDSM
jgi:hypothetical protein